MRMQKEKEEKRMRVQKEKEEKQACKATLAALSACNLLLVPKFFMYMYACMHANSNLVLVPNIFATSVFVCVCIHVVCI